MCETVSETDFSPQFQDTVFVPNSFSDISAFLDKKIDIMRIYKGEMGEHPFPRSEKTITALAAYRGSMAGVAYAESFAVVKEIW
jgi:N-acetylglucosamine malate deacetylase 1